MAIVSMQKVAILAHHSVKEEVLEKLYEEGMLQISEAGAPSKIDHTEVNFRSAEVQFAITTLKEVASKQTLALLRKSVTAEDIIHAAQHTDVREIVDMLHKLEDQDTEAERQLQELRSRRELLEHWRALSSPLDAPAESRTTVRILGTLPAKKVTELSDALKSECPRSELDMLNTVKDVSFIATYVWKEEADHLMEGKNPYKTPVTEVYHGWIKEVPAYVYLPSVLYLQTIGRFLFGDVRYALIIAQFGFLFFLWRTYRQRMDRTHLELIVLLFLLHPRGIFVIEQAWTDMFILCFFGLSLWLHQQGRFRSAAAAYGYMLSLKQYLFFFVFHWFLIERRWKHFLLALGVAALSVLPFVLWDFQSFIDNGLLYNLNLPFRSGALIFFEPFNGMWGFVPSGPWTLIVGTVTAVLTFLFFRKRPMPLGYLQAVTITTFALFFVGGRATINYYYFVGGLMVILLLELHSHHSHRSRHPDTGVL